MKLPFIVLALLILGSAGVAMSRRNLIHSTLLLIGAWFGVAGFYLWAGAEFAAFAQVLVYGGAVSMVVLFAVLLTRQNQPAAAAPGETRERALAAAAVAVAVLVLLGQAVRGWPRLASAGNPSLSVRQIGLSLMGEHAPALLAIGLLLTVALIGAVVLAAAPAGENREDPP